MDDKSVVVFITRRSANLVAMNSACNLSLQKVHISVKEDTFEKVIRAIKGYIPDTNADQLQKTLPYNKTKKIQELRLVLIDLKRQEDYLTVAKDHGLHYWLSPA